MFYNIKKFCKICYKALIFGKARINFVLNLKKIKIMEKKEYKTGRFMKYLNELPIGTKFLFHNNRGVYTLTHKLGENGYESTTHPFRYRDSFGVDIPTQFNQEVIPLPNKGDSYTEETAIPGQIVTSTCIGYVAGIEYPVDGTFIEWLLNKKGILTKLQESPKIFATPEQAERFIKKLKPEYTQYIYYRPYFCTTYKNTLSE